jgi:hypothetical protein
MSLVHAAVIERKYGNPRRTEAAAGSSVYRNSISLSAAFRSGRTRRSINCLQIGSDCLF